jgi:hypothetical protein
VCNESDFQSKTVFSQSIKKQNKLRGFSPQENYQFFLEVMGLERGPFSLVRIIEELFQGNGGSGLENRN